MYGVKEVMFMARLRAIIFGEYGGVIIKVKLDPSEVELVRRAERRMAEGEYDEEFERWFRRTVLPQIPRELRQDALEGAIYMEGDEMYIDTGE